MTELRSRLTDEQVDKVLQLALDIAWVYHFADDEVQAVEDRSWCPYTRRGLPGADPTGSCSYGCYDEPVCHTGGPYPLQELDLLLTPTGIFDLEEAP